MTFAASPVSTSDRRREDTSCRGERRHHDVARRVRDGPDPDLEHGLGHGGEPLTRGPFSADEVDQAQAEGRHRAFRRGGDGSPALRHHRRPGRLERRRGLRRRGGRTPPFIVVTHESPSRVDSRTRLQRSFTDGIASAIDQARARAGDREVVIMGGGDVVRSGTRRRTCRPAPPPHRAHGAPEPELPCSRCVSPRAPPARRARLVQRHARHRTKSRESTVRAK